MIQNPRGREQGVGSVGVIDCVGSLETKGIKRTGKTQAEIYHDAYDSFFDSGLILTERVNVCETI